jgi:hypothetical protein
MTPQPSGPVAPVPLDQLPATPPQVSYQNGELTIAAQNSTLGDILREVHKATGAAIDVPASANERVVAKLGPAPPRDVLASLLNGSSFNYVMVGSAIDPDALATVMLTAKTAGGVGAAPQTAEVYQPPPVRTGFLPPPLVAPAVASADEKDEDDSEDADDSADQDQAAGAPQQQVVQPDPNAAAQADQPNAGPKSPQQIMEMLRQTMQQQKKQADNPGDPPPQQ